jgi:signal transduction histidine kinase
MRIGVEQLLPAWGAGDARPMRRTVRDWVVDATASLLSLLASGLTIADAIITPRPETAGWIVVDAVAGVVVAAALWLRRRWPLGVAIGLLPLVVVAPSGAVAALFAGFSVAVHRSFGTAAAVVVAQVLFTVIGYPVRPGPLPYWVNVVGAALLGAVILLWGQMVRARRLLELSLRDRVARVEAEQQERVQQARLAERTRIAREMHDVLAHRMSLLSMHAGALVIRQDLPADERTTTARIIQDGAHAALVDLRQVIGVLRGDGGPGPAEPDRPQPTLRDVLSLLAEARLAGDRIDTGGELVLPDVAPSTGRDAYRVLQEALTNARKHAPGETVRVRIDTDSDALVLAVRNRTRSTPAGIPGAGVGLVGLAERVRLAGGELHHEVCGAEFELRARLPCRP